jgi:hypothetical protein
LPFRLKTGCWIEDREGACSSKQNGS